MAECEASVQEALSAGDHDLANKYLRMTDYYRFRAKYINGPIFPTENLQITIDKEAVRRSGMKILGDSIPDVMNISLEGRAAIYKSEVMMLEMLANANWERPMYVAVTVVESAYGSLGNNFIQEGLVNRITPFETGGNVVDTDKMYDNLMHKFKFGGIDKPGVYLDETVMRMCWTHRRMFAQLVSELIKEEKTQRALEVLKYAEKVMPTASVPHSLSSGSDELARGWAALGQYDKAMKIADEMKVNGKQYIDWYNYATQARKRDMNYTLCYRDGIRPFTSTFSIYFDFAADNLRKGKSSDAKAQFSKLLSETDQIGQWFGKALESEKLDDQQIGTFINEYVRVIQVMKSIEDTMQDAGMSMDAAYIGLSNRHEGILEDRYMQIQLRERQRAKQQGMIE